MYIEGFKLKKVCPGLCPNWDDLGIAMDIIFITLIIKIFNTKQKKQLLMVRE